MEFAILSKKDDHSNTIAKKINDELVKNGWVENKLKPDLVICVGGDGTLLYAVHQYVSILESTSFVGVHTGTLGFLTDYTDQELDLFLSDVLSKKPQKVKYNMLEILIDNDQPVYALNEFRIENVIRTQNTDIYLDNEFFESCRGSGICISSQSGSTAYIRGLNGAVIDNGLQVMQFSEITPIQHAKHRSLRSPFIMMNNRVIRIESENFEDAILCYDHLSKSIGKASKITCALSKKAVSFARYREYSYLKRLKNLY